MSTAVIERREYKYLIDNATADAIRLAIRPFCALDGFAARSPDRCYTVESLYFDTPDLDLFWANHHEQVDRIKMRVRGYAEAPNAPVYFEVKRRINDIISKSRGRVPRSLWAGLLADPGAALPAEIEAKDRGAVERFVSLVRTLHVRPFTLVRYSREPYFSTIDDYARVTFDRRICAHKLESLSLIPSGGGWRPLDDTVTQRSVDSMVVLELKFTNYVPLWLSNLARTFGLVRDAFSKYGTSIKAFFRPYDMRTPSHAGGWS